MIWYISINFLFIIEANLFKKFELIFLELFINTLYFFYVFIFKEIFQFKCLYKKRIKRKKITAINIIIIHYYSVIIIKKNLFLFYFHDLFYFLYFVCQKIFKYGLFKAFLFINNIMALYDIVICTII